MEDDSYKAMFFFRYSAIFGISPAGKNRRDSEYNFLPRPIQQRTGWILWHSVQERLRSSQKYMGQTGISAQRYWQNDYSIPNQNRQNKRLFVRKSVLYPNVLKHISKKWSNGG